MCIRDRLGAALLWAGAGALPAMIVTGRLWARYGRSLLPATLLLFGLSAVGPAVAGDVAQLAGIAMTSIAPDAPLALAGLVIAGLGISLIAPALFSRAGRLAGDRSRGAAIAGLTAFGYLGSVSYTHLTLPTN